MQELRNETIRRDQTIQQLETELDALRARNADLLAALERIRQRTIEGIEQADQLQREVEAAIAAAKEQG